MIVFKIELLVIIIFYFFHSLYFCRSELAGRLVHCDFCPLAFHMDCVNPPLTTVPNGMWMCPNHAEHAEVHVPSSC